MFKKAGYTTGLFGKQQPLPNGIRKEHRTKEDYQKYQERNEAAWKFRQENGRFPNELNVYQDFGYYVQSKRPQLFDYDYSFIKPGLCCNPGLYFENGKSTEAAETWVQTRPFPENTPPEVYDPVGYTDYPYTAFYGPPGYVENMVNSTELPLYYMTWTRQNIAGKTFDSRNVEQEVSQRVLNFIDEHHEQPFFAYYAMHSGHAPFNSAERFRNQTEAGILGEVIMEADEIVGQIIDKLEEHEIADDTLVILMTDNGPTITGEQIKELFGHNQWLVDLPESANLPARTVQLQDRINHAIQELENYSKIII